MTLRIAVLLGGDTSEREISLDSGAAVARALRERGHQVSELDLRSPAQVLAEPDVRDSDVVFPVLHGGWGEDGRIQALLELLGKAYVGSGPAASAVAMDKVWTKQICRALDIPTADWVEIVPDADTDDVLEAAAPLGFPLVWKPVREGSAVGVQIPASADELAAAVDQAGSRTTDWMLEAYVAGRELTVPWLWGAATPVVEIRPRDGFYDYTHKYTAGSSEYDCPAELEAAVAAHVADVGHRVACALRLRDMARIDIRLSQQQEPFVLEANTIPGMTAMSLLPLGAAADGMDFAAMCDRLVIEAVQRGPDLGRST